MKRSEINAIMRGADAFLAEHAFHLPPFAYWTPAEWQQKGPEAREIAAHSLGWDITDFGSGRYDEVGLFLFTIRNGTPAALAAGRGKVYCEKVLIVDEGQVTPLHTHYDKTEDIINRGGGTLAIQLYNCAADGSLEDSDVTVSMDGVVHTAPAGDVVRLAPGESITLVPGVYHKFWGEGSRVLVGEVSTVNDDNADNRFHQPIGRFPQIEEDAPPLYLLVNDYDAYYRPDTP